MEVEGFQASISSSMRYYHVIRPSLILGRWPLSPWPVPVSQRSVRHQAFDALFDQDQLAEARKWHQSFQLSNLPQGTTTYSRSSGPGGQHVNKCVAMSSWVMNF